MGCRKFLTAALVLSACLIFCYPVFAQTQNVKVGGSLDAYWFYRSDFDLSHDHGGMFQGGISDDTKTNRTNGDDFFMSIAQLNVAADLTDQVSAKINVINQRDWNASVYDPELPGDVSTAATAFDVNLDEAYIEMKGIFYEPLTLKIGRQDIALGREFIIASNQTDPVGTMSAEEFSVFEAFDAVRATLDFDPWTVDLIYSKMDEGNINNEDDIDLYTAYLTHKFSDYNAVADLYWIGYWDRSLVNVLPGKRSSDTESVGGRVQLDPIPQMTLGAEAAYQFGHYEFTSTAKKDRDAWGLDLFATYRFENQWKPDLTAEYVRFSGESDLSDDNSSYGSWNFLCRGPTYGWIHEYLEQFYTTAQEGDQPAGQNLQSLFLTLNLNPAADLRLSGTYYWYWAVDDIHLVTADPSSPKLGDFIGQEIDTKLTYTYTEDVQFGIEADWFVPGSLYQAPNNKTASQLITSVSVSY
ncbi:MAG: alginate export family protein [Candidatus Omnitrophota bacterium]